MPRAAVLVEEEPGRIAVVVEAVLAEEEPAHIVAVVLEVLFLPWVQEEAVARMQVVAVLVSKEPGHTVGDQEVVVRLEDPHGVVPWDRVLAFEGHLEELVHPVLLARHLDS